MEAPVDGEGYPTREVVLVEEGALRQPLRSWRQASPPDRAVGCIRRPSWRDLPRIGCSHLYLRSDPETPAADLLSSVARGYYLVDTTGGGHFVHQLSDLIHELLGFFWITKFVNVFHCAGLSAPGYRSR